jgi:hypothetical protein
MGLITQANRISRDQPAARISIINCLWPLEKIKQDWLKNVGTVKD